jgi:hypothetical protein
MKKQKLEGKIIEIGNLEQGKTKEGYDWKNQHIILSTDPEEGYSICLTFLNSNTKLVKGFRVDEWVEVEYYLTSKEYKGNWFTDIVVLDMERIEPELEVDNHEDTVLHDDDVDQVELSSDLEETPIE